MSELIVRRRKSRIILTLDVDTVEEAQKLMEQCADEIGWVKVGLQLITAQKAGSVVAIARQLGYEVFWDGKPNDIPRTVAAAVKAAAGHGARFINVHANCGVEGMMAAVASKGSALILVVTALTSHGTEEVELDLGASRKAKVLYYARMATYAGCDGLICSPKELDFLAKVAQRSPFPEVQLGKLIKVISREHGLWGLIIKIRKTWRRKKSQSRMVPTGS